MKCKHEGCNEGHFIVGSHPEEYVTQDMATDACDMQLAGALYREEEPIWGACPCCDGANYENCPNCGAHIN
jgi:hypothetical protein